MRFLVTIIIVLSSLNFFSQGGFHRNRSSVKTGKFYASWGYNRAVFDRSDITFKGNGYNFTIKGAKAKDRPSDFDPNVYFSLTKLSIPQFNFRVGYFINDNFSVSLGTDHMKYVLDNTQNAPIHGSISSTVSTEHAGKYNGEFKDITSDFVSFEHTDGLNYVSAEAEYNDNFWRSYYQRFSLDFVLGGGIGAMIPKTNAHLFNNTIGADAFHLAGGGVSGTLGIRFYFFKHFYIHTAGKTGWLFMPNIATNGLEIDKASQTIHFKEFYMQFGAIFSVFK